MTIFSLERLRRNTILSRQDSKPPGKDTTPKSPKYNAGVAIIRNVAFLRCLTVVL